MGRVTVFGFVALLSSAACTLTPQLDLYPDIQPWLPISPGTEPIPIHGPECLPDLDNDDPYKPGINSDGQIRVIIQKTNQQEQLRTAGFQPYPVKGGYFYINPNPDVVIQPPPIIVRPPQCKPIQPSPFEVEPPLLPPITPPSICVKPGPLPPINIPPILVRPKPMPPISPPAIFVRPPKIQPIQPKPIIIRQPELPVINQSPIVIRPHSPGTLCQPAICLRTSVLENQDDNDRYSLFGSQ